MNLFEKLKKSAETRKERKAEEQNERRAAVFEEDLVAFVKSEVEKRQSARLPYELQWRLNTEFLLGNQMCDINVHRMTVENYEPVYDYMSREVFNRIAPIMQTRRAHLLAVSYDLAVRPGSDDYEDLQKAEAATALMNHTANSDEYKEAFCRAVDLVEETGSAFFLTWWDPSREGGAPALTALTPYEVLPEDLTEETVEKQRSLIITQIKTADEVRDLYGVDVEGGEENCFGYTRTAGAGGFGYEGSTPRLTLRTRENAVLLCTYMEKPTAGRPGGRLIITAGGKLLYAGALPYDGYPVAQIKSEQMCGQFFGKSVIETLIPYQRCYNGIKNRINDFINRASFGQLLVEEGSVDADDLSSRGLAPGEPVIYERGAALPKLLEEPKLPDCALAQCTQLAEDMEYAACVSGLMADSRLPGGVVSGTAIRLLQSADTLRLSVYADNIREGLIRLFRIWLSLYRRYMGSGKTISLAGETGKRRDLTVRPEDLDSDELVFRIENELKTDRDAARGKYLEALQLGLFSEDDGSLSKRAKLRARAALLDKDLLETSEEEQQMKNARAENTAFERGETPEILLYDDHLLHLEEHRMYVLQKRFRALLKRDPAKCAAMTEHIKAHEKALAAEQTGKEENDE